MADFQKAVYAQPAPAVEGDFASANPRRSMIAGPGALTVGAAGCTIGKFAFARNDTGVVTSAHPGVLSRVGFVQRDNIALITNWLGSDTLQMPAGVEVTLFDGGDFWGRFAGGVSALGLNVYASYADGSLSAGSSAPAGASFTGVVVANVLTASAVTGTIVPGAPFTGTGVAAGAYIVNQLTGTPGGAGTYTVAVDSDTTSTAMTTTGGVDTGFKTQSTAGNGELAKISTL